MCTLTLAWQVFPETPVVVAANRDELLARPSRPPAVVEDDPRIVAPLDEEAGGTWIGYNEHGLFVGVTNRWVDLEGDRSRGLLVRDALRHESAEDATRFVERELAETDYAGFNLVLADSTAAVLVEYDGQPHVQNLEPGIHVVVNVGANGDFFLPDGREEFAERQGENARAVREALQPEPGENADEWLSRAADVISDHDYGVCVHYEERGYGTRSSSLVSVHADGTGSYEFADGPPCVTAYRQVEVTRPTDEHI